MSAAEPEEVVTANATETDAEALDETQEVVCDESKVDADGFVWYGTTIVKYVGKGGNVKIPEKCTGIGDDGFQGCSSLTSIEIPSSITHIEDYAYEDSALKTIYGTLGSYAETYAKTNHYEFIDVANKSNTGNTENPGATPDITITYRTHVQSIGWQKTVTNGVMSGTFGKAKRLEGIRIVLVPKGSAAPANNYKNIQSVNTKAYIKK